MECDGDVEVPSDVVPFEQRPWMKCAEITVSDRAALWSILAMRHFFSNLSP